MYKNKAVTSRMSLMILQTDQRYYQKNTTRAVIFIYSNKSEPLFSSCLCLLYLLIPYVLKSCLQMTMHLLEHFGIHCNTLIIVVFCLPVCAAFISFIVSVLPLTNISRSQFRHSAHCSSSLAYFNEPSPRNRSEITDCSCFRLVAAVA